MSINDICFNIPYNKTVNLNHNALIETNSTLSFIEGWQPPLVFMHNDLTRMCGPLVKILEIMSKKLGSK